MDDVILRIFQRPLLLDRNLAQTVDRSKCFFDVQSSKYNTVTSATGPFECFFFFFFFQEDVSVENDIDFENSCEVEVGSESLYIESKISE